LPRLQEQYVNFDNPDYFLLKKGSGVD